MWMSKPVPDFTDEQKAKVRAFLAVLNDYELRELADLYPSNPSWPVIGRERRMRPLILSEISRREGEQRRPEN